MQTRLKVPPTKSALLAIQRQEQFLVSGYSLLERKRELLTRLVYERLAHYRQLRREAQQVLESAYRSLAITQLRMGTRMLRQAGLGLEPAIRVRILARSNLGVEYPSLTAKPRPMQPVSLMWTDTSFDQTRKGMAELALILARLGEAETSLRRMLAEQRKTQKRVNALKNNVIPRYRETIRYIEQALEEEERNSLFQIKTLRAKSEP
ncbi:MAG: V-type ATP synthase subunit D [Chromatiales bacterium]|nr:V-type ATP synthase subunit D [Chromatiales bacterium]